ncbi:MAG: ABC transporter permease [Deltaproteobacteria bacterium]|jgi:putative ABC transport system permease protein|nr:ABC transporter permease [Deltaproteobacteria bacterium]
MKSLLFFLRLFIWFSLRNMRRHMGRAATVLFGIALGAAVFTSVRLSVNASLESFSKSMDLIAGQADYVLTRPGGYVPENLMATLLRQEMIQSASPVLSTYTRISQQGAEPFLLIGFDPILDRPLRRWRVDDPNAQPGAVWLELLKAPYTLVLGKPLDQQLKRIPGGTLVLEHARQKARFKVSGILEPSGLALAEGGRIALTDIATFQEFTGLFGKVDRIDLKLAPRAGARDLAVIQHLLPEGVELNPPTATRESGQMMIRAYQLNLSILSFASLFVGMFLVYSLVALNAASRRHELAVLRATGASAYHVFFIFLAEGAFLGIAGWLVAIPLGNFLIKYLLHGVSQTISTLFVRVQVDRLSLSVFEIGFSFVVTVGISILAAYQPAREAMQVPPKEALEISHLGMQPRISPRQLAFGGLGCILMVLPLSKLPAILGMPLPGYLAIFLLFVGFALLAPWALVKISHILSSILLKRFGIPAYLAGRYVRDSGTRTAVSVGALITAVALFAALVIMIFSFRQTVAYWTYETIKGDLFLTSKMGQINRFRYPVPQPVIDYLQHYRSQVDILPNRQFFLTYKKYPYVFELMDMQGYMQYASFFWLKGDPEKIRPLLKRGEGVIVSEVFSNRTGLSVGDFYEAQVEGSAVRLPILGIVRDYRTQGGAVFYSLPHFNQRYHPVYWGGLRFFFKDRSQDLDAAVARLRNDIIARLGDRVDMYSGKGLRGAVLRIFDETFAVTTVLLLIALLIAGLGIATTLTVLVLQRSRQLNTLYAIGASFRQIRSMISWEAAFLVVIGELAGVVCGFILSYLLIYVVNRQSFGWTFIYAVDWDALLLSIPLIILTALAAALPAVKMVFRRPPATLLRER